MHTVLLVFLIIVLVLIIGILVLIIVNAVRRTCTAFAPTNDDNGPKTKKNVDLFVARVSELPQGNANMVGVGSLALPGMTALIDLGMFHTDTGIYMLQNNNVWVKIGVPEVGDQFTILRGEHSRKQHTIRPSFLQELRPPSEVQIVTNNVTFQNLQETTDRILVQHDVVSQVQIAVNGQHALIHSQNAGMTGRMLTIVNTSQTFDCLLTFKPVTKTIVVRPATIVHVQLQIQSTLQGHFYYDPVACSEPIHN